MPSVDVDALTRTTGAPRKKSRRRRGALASACAETALATALGYPVTPEQLPALCAALADWTSDDDESAGEGIRALPDDERDVAFRFLKNRVLLARFGLLVNRSPKLFQCFLRLDPVNGPLVDADRYQGVGRLERGRRMYEAAVAHRRRAMAHELVCTFNSVMRGHPKPAQPVISLRTRGRTGSPRRREHRSTTRRKSASRAGPDDPAEPEPPLAVAWKAVVR